MRHPPPHLTPHHNTGCVCWWCCHLAEIYWQIRPGLSCIFSLYFALICWLWRWECDLKMCRAEQVSSLVSRVSHSHILLHFTIGSSPYSDWGWDYLYLSFVQRQPDRLEIVITHELTPCIRLQDSSQDTPTRIHLQHEKYWPGTVGFNIHGIVSCNWYCVYSLTQGRQASKTQS